MLMFLKVKVKVKDKYLKSNYLSGYYIIVSQVFFVSLSDGGKIDRTSKFFDIKLTNILC